MKKLESHLAFALICAVLTSNRFVISAVQAQDGGTTLLELLEGATITADDKRFTNWQLDDFTLGAGAFGGLDGIIVTPLEDQPLNPGIRFSIPNGLGGGSSAVLEFSFDVQTTSGEALIKDNSLWLNGFTIPASSPGLVNIRESVSDADGVPLGFKFVQAVAGDVPDSGDPDHFASAEFAPKSFVHVEKQVEMLGGAVLTMFEQRFSQLPEPSSSALLAIGLFALTPRGARRTVKQSMKRRDISLMESINDGTGGVRISRHIGAILHGALPTIVVLAANLAAQEAHSGDIINPTPPFDLYTVEFDGDLFGVDADTGDATFIGNTGLTAPAGLEFEPATNRLLLLRASGTEPEAVYQINTADASVNKLYDIGFPMEVERMFEGSLAFHPSGLIFATNTEDNDAAGLITVDPQNGQATFIGEFPGLQRDINGIAFRTDGALVGIENFSSSFVRINTDNATLTQISPLDNELTETSGGLTTVDGQTGFLMTHLGVLHRIDLFTGETELIGSNGVAGGPQLNGIDGLAAVLPIIPEPSSLLIAAFGIATLIAMNAIRRRS